MKAKTGQGSGSVEKTRQNAFVAPCGVTRMWMQDAQLGLGPCNAANKGGAPCKRAAVEIRGGRPLCRFHRTHPQIRKSWEQQPQTRGGGRAHKGASAMTAKKPAPAKKTGDKKKK